MNEQTSTQPAAASSPIWRDLLIPASIVIAGACIGLGLYFSGGLGNAAPSQYAVAQPQEPAEPVDTSDQVREVTEADHIKGSPDAPIMIVEYSDFDCPFCSRFHDAMNQIVQNNDDVAWVYRHFPLEGLHPNARAVSIASECVARLGGEEAFWQFTDGYFANESGGSAEQVVAQLVQATGVDQVAFATCFQNQETNGDVQEDIDNAIATGGRGTPWSIIIGPTGKTYPMNGALPAASVQQLIQVARDEA